jgi:maleylpyruvate isomerase
MDATALNRQVEGLAASHQRLLSTLDPMDGEGLTDEMVNRPSRLPDWTVGHVLAHLARNADSMTAMTVPVDSRVARRTS